MCLSNKRLVFASQLCLCTFYTCSWLVARPICCLVLSCWLLVLQWRAAMQSYFVNEILKNNNFLFLCPLPPQTVYHVILFSSVGSVPKHQQSGPPSNMSQCNICHYEVFGFARANICTCVHTCVRMSWLAFHTCWLCYCVFTGLLNCSEGSRNALIYTVLFLWVCKPPCFRLMTDLLTCSWRGGMRWGDLSLLWKIPVLSSLSCLRWATEISPILSFTSDI